MGEIIARNILNWLKLLIKLLLLHLVGCLYYNMDAIPSWWHTVDVDCITDVARLRNVTILKTKFICKDNWPFFGEFAKLRKATISFFTSVRLSLCLSVRPPTRKPAHLPARMEHLGSQRMDRQEIWYFNIFLKSVKKMQVSLKSGTNGGGTLHENHYIFFITSR